MQSLGSLLVPCSLLPTSCRHMCSVLGGKLSLDTASRRSSQGRQSRKRAAAPRPFRWRFQPPACLLLSAAVCCLIVARTLCEGSAGLSLFCSRVFFSRLCAALLCPLCAISPSASYETRRSDVSGALADGVGRVGALVPFWRVRMWDGDRVVLCGGLCWPGWAQMVQKDQMKSGQDELWS